MINSHKPKGFQRGHVATGFGNELPDNAKILGLNLAGELQITMQDCEDKPVGKIKYQNSVGNLFDITVKQALTSDTEYIYTNEIMANLLTKLVEKKILTFNEAIVIIGESPERYKVE